MAEWMEEICHVAELAKDTAKKGVDNAKLKWAILRLEGSLEDSYTKLGKYLSDHRDHLTEEKCLERITALYRQIDKQKEDLELLRGAKPASRKPSCGACGKVLRRSDRFCPGCGKEVQPCEAAAVTEETASVKASSAAEACAAEETGIRMQELQLPAEPSGESL